MFCPNKNSFLQLQCAVEPRVINKAVQQAMRKKQLDDDVPIKQRLESMQPSLFAPYLDVTRAPLGFGRIGLRLINKQINDKRNFIRLQALQTLLDQVQISQNAMYLIQINVVYRLINLMLDDEPMAREKTLLILTVLTNYYQGRKRILSRPIIIDRLIIMFTKDRKEIRLAAAVFLKSLTSYRCSCESIIKNDKIIQSLIKVIKNDHMEIVYFHINTLKHLSEWDPVKPLKLNAFQLLKDLMVYNDYKITQAALDCLTSFCKHSLGKELADQCDMTKFLQRYLTSSDVEVMISAVGLMQYTTLTIASKWRAKEFANKLVKRLVTLSSAQNIPVLQLRAMRVLVNLCDSPDIKEHIRSHYEQEILKKVAIRSHEQWDGTSETTTYAAKTCHNYRTMCIEDWEAVKNDVGDDALAVNVRCYIGCVKIVKQQLLKAMNIKPDKD